MTPTEIPYSIISTSIYALIISWLWAKRNYWQFQCELLFPVRYHNVKYDNANKLWHRYQWIIWIVGFSYPIVCSYLKIALVWQDLFLGMFIVWIAFDGFLNRLLGKGMLYVGGGWVDGQFKKLGKSAGVVMLITKIACIAFSIWIYKF